jgi:hypothetical protein
VISAVKKLVTDNSLSAKEKEQYLVKINIVLYQLEKVDFFISILEFKESSVSLQNRGETFRKEIYDELKEEIKKQKEFMMKITVKYGDKTLEISIPQSYKFEISLRGKHILEKILQKEKVKKQFYKEWIDSPR